MRLEAELQIQCDTWTHENAGLFDFETRDLFAKTYKVNFSPNIAPPQKLLLLQRGNLVWLSRTRDRSAKELLQICEDSGGLTVHSGRVCHYDRDTQSLLWRVAQQPTLLSQGQLIKLGRLQMRVSEISVSSHVGRNSALEKSMLTEFDTETVAPEGHLEVESLPERKVSSLPVCRICYDPSEPSNPLLSPCACKGSMASIHVACLKRWLTGKVIQRQIDGLLSYYLRDIACELCKVMLPSKVEHPVGSGNFFDLGGLQRPDVPHIILESRIRGERSRGLHLVGVSERARKRMKLGRGLSADVRISDISVSRHHANLSLKDGAFYLQDNNSRFGTLVSQGTSVRLDVGSTLVLQCGRTLVTFNLKRPQLWRSYLPRCCSSQRSPTSMPVLIAASDPVTEEDERVEDNDENFIEQTSQAAGSLRG